MTNAAPAGVAVLPIAGGGVVLRAGDGPQLGDVNRQDLLPLYQAVGRLVSPRRTPDEALKNVVIKGMAEETRHDWLRRFFS